MNYQSKSMERDEVLFAFHEAFERPTAENIVEWTRRYPQFADDIRAHAAVAWDWSTEPIEFTQSIDETLMARAHSQALNLIHSAKQESLPRNSNAVVGRTFQQMRQSAGKEIYQIAEDLDISRSVLSDLFGGRVRPPIGKRLSDKLVAYLQTTSTEFLNALSSALNSPLLGHAKSNNAPRVTVRSYDDAIQRSDMSDDRKRYWLEED
jgi:transcriptional regulator with XRE-family HTH domain